MASDDALTNKAGELAESVQTLVGTVSQLRESNERLASRGRRDRLLIAVTIIGLVLDFALSGLFFAQHLAQVSTNKQIVCQNKLRSETSAISDKDRRNVDSFFATVVTVKTAEQFQLAYQSYLTVRNADDAARAAIGYGSSATCG